MLWPSSVQNEVETLQRPVIQKLPVEEAAAVAAEEAVGWSVAVEADLESCVSDRSDMMDQIWLHSPGSEQQD